MLTREGQRLAWAKLGQIWSEVWSGSLNSGLKIWSACGLTRLFGLNLAVSQPSQSWSEFR